MFSYLNLRRFHLSWRIWFIGCNGWRLRLVDGGCIVAFMARFIVPEW
ncbi:hypothetical protein Hanom_Chr07g00666181 [Helianthus anomalus]